MRIKVSSMIFEKIQKKFMLTLKKSINQSIINNQNKPLSREA
jgi:hypothetical protein